MKESNPYFKENARLSYYKDKFVKTVYGNNPCEISSSHGGEYDVQSCLLGYTAA
jgi:hypothetical protein